MGQSSYSRLDILWQMFHKHEVIELLVEKNKRYVIDDECLKKYVTNHYIFISNKNGINTYDYKSSYINRKINVLFIATNRFVLERLLKKCPKYSNIDYVYLNDDSFNYSIHNTITVTIKIL